jgi:hypothetical protein
MPKQPLKMKSWQVFGYVRKHLGASFLYGIFGTKNARAIDYWCQDPMTTAKVDGAYDPILGLKRMLDVLDDYSHFGAIRSCIDFLLSETSLSCGGEAKIIEPLPTINEEMLADYKDVALLHAAIADGMDTDVVKVLTAAAIAEIERTCAKYCEDFKG